MPRPTRSYGRPGTKPIPDGWAASHAPVVEAAFMTTSTVSLRREGGTDTHFDPAVGHTVTTPYAPFATDVPANIAALTETSVPPASAVEDQVRVLGYLVTIPSSVPVAFLDEGVMVDVVTCPDALLAGQTMHVTDIVRGARLFERALICDLNT